MKAYIEPEVKVIIADVEDILTTSGPENDAYVTDIFGFLN